jgi:thymidylate synthase (FAD)
MKIIKPSYSILYPTDWDEQVKRIEYAARNCYQSKSKGETEAFVRMLVDKNHGAMIEFGDMTVQFITDRGIANQIVRHRLFSFAQESTIYCNYIKKENEITVIEPSTYDSWSEHLKEQWLSSLYQIEEVYRQALDRTMTQQARAILPTALKTSLIVKGNFRQWLNFFKLRAHEKGNPDMHNLVKPLYDEVSGLCPCIFKGAVSE